MLVKIGRIREHYLKKGNKVLVEGRLVPDQNTGGPRVWKRNDAPAQLPMKSTLRRFVPSAVAAIPKDHPVARQALMISVKANSTKMRFRSNV